MDTDNNNADTVIILSSDLIASVMEVHFNKQMFKVPVHIVDLKPTTDGYAFSLVFDTVKPKEITQTIIKDETGNTSAKLNGQLILESRDNKGRFVKVQRSTV